MKPKRFAHLLVIAAALLALRTANAQSSAAISKPPAGTRVDAAFQHFWAAQSPADATMVADEIEKTGVSFDDAFRRLRMGRSYAAQATGVTILMNQTEDGVEHYYAVNIPPTYDPAKRYQVRFQLHGGIGGRTENKPRGTGEIGALAGAEQIYVLPYAWDDAPWWGDDQILNLNAIIDSLKRTYNIDENRVVLSGVSDGATGAYYIAMHDTTPFASFLPLNGFIFVLASDDIDDGRIFPNNLLNKPLFVVNGGQDPLYPTEIVEPFTRHLMSNGVEIAYDPQPNGVHNTMWWPEVKDVFEKFVADHPRNPHPDKLTWETADRFHNRDHWLVINSFGTAPGEAKDLPDANAVHRTETTLIGETHGRLFHELDTAGRVDLVRAGNSVQATTKGVTVFTLLLSPDAFDFNKPIQVVANGKEVFNARVPRSVHTLLKWAAQDNDRTMLYAAELQIKLTQ
jgi:pimeloyl-ACP methyl ester carboxylesterase